MSLILNFCKLQLLRNVSSINQLQKVAACSTKSFLEYNKDPQPLFLDPETQHLLKSMTQLNLDKVFRKRTGPDNRSEMKFMTTEELIESYRKAIERAHQLLQMPPIVNVKENTTGIISKDPALSGFSDTKYVFTDITYAVRQSDRKVLVRDVDGTLSHAPMDVTKRMRQLYFPLPGRKIRMPRMFEDEHLKRCLNEHKYEFILDRLTVQFEPYEAQFHRISSLVYQHLNESKEFDQLRSTRHFGPLAFFYAWHRSIDDLLYDMIRRDYLRNGAELIALMYKIHNIEADYSTLFKRLDSIYPPKDLAVELANEALNSKDLKDNIHDEIKSAIGKNAQDFEADELCLDFIENYIKGHSLKKVQLELALQTLKEIFIEKKQLYEGLTKAHGVQKS